jgi:hypothetical protein
MTTDSTSAETGSENRRSTKRTVVFPYSVETTSDVTSLDWVTDTSVDGVGRFDYTSDPMFGSETRYTGFITMQDNVVYVTSPDGGSRAPATRYDENAHRVSLSPTQQHELLNVVDDGQVIEANHPDHHEHSVHEMGYDRHATADEFRAEIRENTYPLRKIKCQYDDEWISIHFTDLYCDVPATPTAVTWFSDVLTSIRNNESP